MLLAPMLSGSGVCRLALCFDSLSIQTWPWEKWARSDTGILSKPRKVRCIRNGVQNLDWRTDSKGHPARTATISAAQVYKRLLYCHSVRTGRLSRRLRMLRMTDAGVSGVSWLMPRSVSSCLLFRQLTFSQLHWQHTQAVHFDGSVYLPHLYSASQYWFRRRSRPPTSIQEFSTRHLPTPFPPLKVP